ncbi:MAG: hypothetical protein K1060chlam5_01075 [Candidatus Anoxychlamydiales bacterium]|nr:hypothetical protein [Candidatus Anoxychlamydiales bacterium]
MIKKINNVIYTHLSNNLNEDFLNNISYFFFQIASYLTDPVCISHEYFRRFYIIDHHYKNSYKITNLLRKIYYFSQLTFHGNVALFTSIPGIFFRYIGSKIQKKPFLYINNNSDYKKLDSNKFTLLSWNICCVGGGYSLSDGGVMPFRDRIDKIVEKILHLNADVNCLYETFDIKSAFYIYNKLKKHGYRDFYFNIGPKSLGVSSGIFVASKYKINNPNFIPFSKKILVGRTKNAKKGIFSFTLSSDKNDFANIFTTHLQHSEECEYPTDEEIEKRKMQMQLLTQKTQELRDRCTVVCGDLNLDDDEYYKSNWNKHFDKGSIFSSGKKSWLGDEFCAKMVKKRVSKPLNLDHTMILKTSAQNLVTTYIDTKYDPKNISTDALSDHMGLFSEITIL